MHPDEQAYLDAAERGDWAEVERIAAKIDADAAAREARLNAPDALATAAIWYAENGVAIFPCQAGGKQPATTHGFKDATCDVEQVRAWWERWPQANIGAPTGHRFDVIDVDGPVGTRHFGVSALPDDRLLAMASTPRGWHYFVPPTGDGNSAGIFPSVDYRGVGGYVVVAPSRTPAGTYRWVPGRHLNPDTLPHR